MGKGSRTPKKPENLGRGQVTAIQVAFIVNRYLMDNNYTQTLSTFRSEASSLLSPAKLKAAPKSLLSLEDILNDYIRLKEQKVDVDQQRCRVEKLCQGMQEVINAYRSADVTSACYSPYPTSSIPENNPIKVNSGSTNPAFTPVNMTTSVKVQSTISTAPNNNKRKPSVPVSEHSSSSRKSFVQTPETSSGSGMNPLTGPDRAMQSSSTHDLSIPSSLFGQSSVSSSPQTPSQQFCPENGSSDSPLHMPTVMVASEPSFCASPPIEPVRSPYSSENGSTFSDNYVQRQYHMSPSKVSAKTSIRKEHIKGRLDFGDFGMMNSPNSVSSGSICGTGGEVTKNFDMDDMLNFSILDADVSLSYLINLDTDPQFATFSAHMDLDQALHPNTRTTNGVGAIPLAFSGSFSDMLSNDDNVLRHKDINREADDDNQHSTPTATCINGDDSGKGGNRKYSLGQENTASL